MSYVKCIRPLHTDIFESGSLKYKMQLLTLLDYKLQKQRFIE